MRCGAAVVGGSFGVGVGVKEAFLAGVGRSQGLGTLVLSVGGCCGLG